VARHRPGAGRCRIGLRTSGDGIRAVVAIDVGRIRTRGTAGAPRVPTGEQHDATTVPRRLRVPRGIRIALRIDTMQSQRDARTTQRLGSRVEDLLRNTLSTDTVRGDHRFHRQYDDGDDGIRTTQSGTIILFPRPLPRTGNTERTGHRIGHVQLPLAEIGDRSGRIGTTTGIIEAIARRTRNGGQGLFRHHLSSGNRFGQRATTTITTTTTTTTIKKFYTITTTNTAYRIEVR